MSGERAENEISGRKINLRRDITATETFQMPRMPADPVGRLAVLEAARAGVEPGVIVNCGEMAKVAGMTVRNLQTIIESDPEFPVVKQGGMGVPWEIDVAAALDHMIGSARSAKATREARMATVSRLAGLGQDAVVSFPRDGDGAGTGSASELAASARAISQLIDAQGKLRLEKQKQGALIDRETVQALLVDIMSTMQSETLAIPARMDPAGQWDPIMRAGVEEELRNVLVTVRDRIEKTIEGWRGPQR